MMKIFFVLPLLGLISCAGHPNHGDPIAENTAEEDGRSPSSTAPGYENTDHASCVGDGYVTALAVKPNGDIEYSTLYGGHFVLLSRNAEKDSLHKLSRSIASQKDSDPVYVGRTILKSTNEIVSVHYVPKCETPK